MTNEEIDSINKNGLTPKEELEVLDAFEKTSEESKILLKTLDLCQKIRSILEKEITKLNKKAFKYNKAKEVMERARVRIMHHKECAFWAYYSDKDCDCDRDSLMVDIQTLINGE
jgi:ribonuclease D